MRFTIVLITLLFAGCKSYYLNKYCKPETTRVDSTVFVTKDSTVIKDSLVITPATQSTIYLPSPCDSNGRLKTGTYTSSQGNNKMQIVVTDTGITGQSYCEESVKHWRALYQQSQDSLFISRDVREKTVVEKPVKLSLFQRFKLATGFFWWIGAAAVLYMGYKIFRLVK